MARTDPSSTTIDNLVGSRLAATGIDVWAIGTQPYFYPFMEMLYHLDLQSASWCHVGESDSGAMYVNIRPGRITIDATNKVYAGGDVDLSAHNNDTAYVWIYITGGAATIAFAADGTGWPSYTHIKLAEVTLASGAITSIVDRRADAILDTQTAKPRADLAEDALAMYQQSLTLLRNEDGTVMDATGAAGKFKLVSGGWGTGTLTIETPAVQNSSDDIDCLFEFALPVEYVADEEVKVQINAKYTLAGGTTVTHTIDCEVYEIGDDGTVSADLCATAAQTLTASFADYVFAITDTALTPGDRLMVLVRCSVSEGDDAGTIKGEIGSIELQLDVKG